MVRSYIEQAQRPLGVMERQRGGELVPLADGKRLEGYYPFCCPDDGSGLTIEQASLGCQCCVCGISAEMVDCMQALPGVVPPANPLLTWVQQHYHTSLLAQPMVMRWLEREYGISEEGIRRCGLGFADGSALLALSSSTMRQEAYRIGVLASPGHERMRGRITIPVCCDHGCSWMIGWSVPTQTSHPTYLGLFLSKPLLGYGYALGQMQRHAPIRAIVVVESALAYVIAVQWDLPIACVALAGTHPSRQQLGMLLDLLRRIPVPVLINLDAGRADQQASRDLRALLIRYDIPATIFPSTSRDSGEPVLHASQRDRFWCAIEALLASEERGACS